MIKTILALLVIIPVIAFNIHYAIKYPFIMWLSLIIVGFYTFIYAWAWATDHIWSLVKSKS